MTQVTETNPSSGTRDESGVPVETTSPVGLEGAEDAATGTDTAATNPHFQWYAVVIQSNMEKRAKLALEERIKKKNLQGSFGRIIIPTQTSEKFDEKSKKKKVETKMMPGYIFVEMEMNDPTYHLVKDTPKVGNFLGAALNKMPPPLTQEEVDRVINRAAVIAKEEAAKPRAIFEKGEKVKVIDGPFTNFVGEVDEVKADKQKLRLLISVFGRPTPVEIEYSKVEKVDPNAEPS
jgi:transcriptional antiterminator NusG